MEERVRFRAAGLVEIVVRRGIHYPTYADGEIHVGDTTLRYDATHSTLLDMAAAILLPYYEYVRGDERWLHKLALTYRARVVREEYSEARSKLGPIAGMVEARASYPPASRMSKLRLLYPCIYNRALEDLERLEEAYVKAHKKAGYKPRHGGRVALIQAKSPATGRGKDLSGESIIWATIGSPMMHLGAMVMQRGATTLWRLPQDITGCSPHTLLLEPWRLLSLPEGSVSLSCSTVDTVVGQIVGEGYECSSPNPISSSLKCTGPRGTVIVKSYTRMYPKWIPAAIAASPVYRYRLSPKDRMHADYRYLRLLRGLVETPSIYHVCGDWYNAKMVRSYLEGRVLLQSRDPEDWRTSGRALARIHKSGYTIGDTNPGNFLVTPRGAPGIIDAEQAREASMEGMAWDLIVMAVTSVFYGAPEEVVAEFIASYMEDAGARAVKEATKDRYWIGLYSVPIIAHKARGIIKGALKGDHKV